MPSSLPFKNVLLVDDDVDEYTILQEAFEEVNNEIQLSFINGGYKLDVAKHLDVDLVFLDINMPGCDGFECLRKIREAGHAQLPIVMYTTSGHVDQVLKAYDWGATLFMIKPNGYNKLVKELESLFNYNWNDVDKIKHSYFKDGNFIPV